MASEADWHRRMLADQARVSAFAEAVRRAVRPGDVVLDIGTGTGLLAMLACRAGAGRVYAVEQGHIIDVAERAAHDNGLAERIVFVRGNSRQVELPEAVDLVIGEIIGGFGLDERILDSYADARRRFLRPGGRLLPDRLDLFLAPSEEGGDSGWWLDELRARHDLDMSALAELTDHVITAAWADPARFLAQPVRALSCDLCADAEGGTRASVEATLERDGELATWAGWFAAFYDGEQILATLPPATGSSWKNLLFPVGRPVRAATGAVARLDLELDGPLWSWHFTLSEPPTERRLGDFYGYPPSTFAPEPGSPQKSRPGPTEI